jgi:hypothetical protein
MTAQSSHAVGIGTSKNQKLCISALLMRLGESQPVRATACTTPVLCLVELCSLSVCFFSDHSQASVTAKYRVLFIGTFDGFDSTRAGTVNGPSCNKVALGELVCACIRVLSFTVIRMFQLHLCSWQADDGPVIAGGERQTSQYCCDCLEPVVRRIGCRDQLCPACGLCERDLSSSVNIDRQVTAFCCQLRLYFMFGLDVSGCSLPRSAQP